MGEGGGKLCALRGSGCPPIKRGAVSGQQCGATRPTGPCDADVQAKPRAFSWEQILANSYSGNLLQPGQEEVRDVSGIQDSTREQAGC